MKQENFILQLRMAYQGLTKAERKVADFVMEHAPEVLYMSITDLADACAVGETTVFRFCKSMKLQGYQEFKIQLSLSMQNEETERGQDILTDSVGMDDTFEVMTQKLLNSNMSVLTETKELLNKNEMELLIDKMLAAERIFFFGVGSSQIVALFATNKFLRILSKVYCFTDSHMQTMAASTLTERDAAIVISYSGSTKDTLLFAKLAKERGAFTAAITRFLKSPMSGYADMVLLCGANEGPLQGGSTTAVMSQLFLMDVLYIEFYRRTYDSSYINNQMTSQSVIDKMY